ncbi:MAG: hypothetical protein WCS42_08720 [Verrucomicrobiota bacterium]
MRALLAIACAFLLVGCQSPGPATATRRMSAVPQARSAVVIAPPAKFLLISWRNYNVGDTNVVTGLATSTNLALPMEQWVVRCETNCNAEINSFALPLTEPQEFIRAYAKAINP